MTSQDNRDILSLLQSHYTILHQQIFSTASYLSQRHPLSPPPSDPYSRDLTQPGREDTDLAQTAHPLHPVSRETFSESQKQLSEDLVRKVQQIQNLVEKLPGGDRDEYQQTVEVKRLAEELKGVEKERKESRRQMRQLTRRLEGVVGGMSKNIEVETNGHD
jgi:Subunit 21 of Mediator complex